MLPPPLDRAANAGEMRRALISFTYERKKLLLSKICVRRQFPLLILLFRQYYVFMITVIIASERSAHGL
jgi:hypothetical protein